MRRRRTQTMKCNRSRMEVQLNTRKLKIASSASPVLRRTSLRTQADFCTEFKNPTDIYTVDTGT